MKAKNVIAFLLVVVIIVACAYIAAFDVTIGGFRVPSTFDKERGIRQGLDLVGGSVIVFEPDVEDLSTVTDEDMVRQKQLSASVLMTRSLQRLLLPVRARPVSVLKFPVLMTPRQPLR